MNIIIGKEANRQTIRAEDISIGQAFYGEINAGDVCLYLRVYGGVVNLERPGNTYMGIGDSPAKISRIDMYIPNYNPVDLEIKVL